jgi:hypothetical protein
MEKKDHDDDDNGPEGQILVKGTQKFSSDFVKFLFTLTQYFFHFNIMYSCARYRVGVGEPLDEASNC